MIYVSEDQLRQVEYLIEQSLKGNHVLFESSELREAFVLSRDSLEMEDAYEVEHHIEKIMAAPDLAQKRAYFERLDRPTRKLVVRTYFHIVENNLMDHSDVRH